MLFISRESRLTLYIIFRNTKYIKIKRNCKLTLQLPFCKVLTIINPILPGLFWSFSARGGGCLVPPLQFLYLTFNQLESWYINRYEYKLLTHKNLLSLFLEMTSFPIFYNFFVSCSILLKFCTDLPLSITNKNSKFC